MVQFNHAANRSSKLLLASFILLVGDRLTGGIIYGEAYVLPPAFPSMNYPMIRMPTYGGSTMDGAPSRQSSRPQRLIQRLLDSQQQQQQQDEVDPNGNGPMMLPAEGDEENLARKSRRSNQIYDSFRKYDPNRFAENSPEWNLAMIQYLLDMKKHGHKIKEIETSKPLPLLHKDLTQGPHILLDEADEGSDIVAKVPAPGIHESPKDSVTVVSPSEGDPVICKMEPFNICYRVDAKGNMHALGDRRPVRLLRVYKK